MIIIIFKNKYKITNTQLSEGNFKEKEKLVKGRLTIHPGLARTVLVF
jgi:hypothetical protein